jgi:hypothetical protein
MTGRIHRHAHCDGGRAERYIHYNHFPVSLVSHLGCTLRTLPQVVLCAVVQSSMITSIHGKIGNRKGYTVARAHRAEQTQSGPLCHRNTSGLESLSARLQIATSSVQTHRTCRPPQHSSNCMKKNAWCQTLNQIYLAIPTTRR